MDEEEPLFTRIVHGLLKAFAVFAILYFVITEYALYWYLEDHYETAICSVVGKQDFENGGYTYVYQFDAAGKTYVSHSIASDLYAPPAVGEKFPVKYLQWWPVISVPDFTKKLSP